LKLLKTKVFEFWNIKEKRFHLISMVVVAVLISCVYWNTLDNEFTNWDDGALILNNTNIRSLSIDNLKNIFSLKAGGTYQPMRVFSYAIDYSISKHNPLAFHVHNILLHILSSILLYMLLLKALPRIERGVYGKSVSFMPLPDLIRVLSLFAALLFALHPVNVESVTWMSSRKYVLLAFFSFASFLFYLQRPVNRKLHLAFYSLSFIFWILAVMSSPFGVALPALFVLFEYCSHPKKNPFYCLKDNLYRFSPYILLGVLVLAYLLVKLGAGDRIKSASVNIFITMMQVFFDYMRNFVSPFWLNNRYVDYVYPSLFAYYKVGAGFCLLFSFVATSAYLIIRKNDKLFFFVLFWFIISWLPASNIVPISTRMADRYVYLASVGFFVFFSWAVVYFLNFLSTVAKAARGMESTLLFSIMVLIVVFVSSLSIIRNNVWQNSGTLWNNSLSRDAGNLIALNNYGLWLHKQGQVEKAKKYFLLSSYVKPSEDLPLKNLGRLYLMEGELDKAELAYKKLLEFHPDSMLAHRMLWGILEKQGRGMEAEDHIDFVLSDNSLNVIALNQKGLILYESEKYGQAEDLFKKAIENFPSDPELHFNLGMTLQKTGRLDLAFKSFAKAAEIKFDFAMAYDRMGQILYGKSNYKGAMEMYDKAINAHSGLGEIYCDMGNVFFAQNDFEKADKYYKKAIELDKTIYEAIYNQCVIVEKNNKMQEAIDCYSKCLDEFDNHPEVLNNLGSIMLGRKDYEKAEKYLLEAIAIDDSSSDAQYNLALLYKNINKPEKAWHHYRSFAEKSSDNFEMLHGICAMLGDSGNMDEAVSCYERILQKNPESAIDHFQLGIVFLRKGLKNEALVHFKKALEIDPENEYFKQFLEKKETKKNNG
jgi:protein O-mannosyl-transferase